MSSPSSPTSWSPIVLRNETVEGVSWLTFDRPERLNAFDADGYRALARALADAGEDDATRVVVLTGAGRAFSAGADRSLLDPGADAVRADAGEAFAQLLMVLRDFEKPLIGAVNGLAVGFGCTVLLYCDLVVAAASARFRLPFTELGIVPEAGSSALLPRRARWDEAAWVMLSGEWFDATEAQRLGVVFDVVPDGALVAGAQERAATIAARDPDAVRATKRLLGAGWAEVAERATARELEAMARLHGRPPRLI
ncbi:MAG: enoyl-CoA hydratase/isomerase family protein [Actinobacteria bacterium]|nr:enoyl-CoA hydratase/isomerase family protein [Actinomycetota bacterium]